MLQDLFFVLGTIISNVTINDPNITWEIVIDALKAVGADRFFMKMPGKHEKKGTEGGTIYSLGKRQLISFARALAFDTIILILDKVAANIYTETENTIQDALKVLKEGSTTPVTVHRLSTIQ